MNLQTLGIATSLIALTACGGGGESSNGNVTSPLTLESLISSARAQSAEDVPRGLPPPSLEEIRKLISLGGAAPREGGVLGRMPAGTAEKQVGEKAFVINSWNYLKPRYCITLKIGGAPVLYMYFADLSFIYTFDQTNIVVMSSACTTAPLVGVYVKTVTGGAVTSYSGLLVNHLN